jgi:putative ABC transport system permease protein
MGKVAVRGLLARKTRLALTALAVALGVTLIAGTYVFTDTINRSFDRIFAAAYQGVDVVLTPSDDIETSDGTSPPIDGRVLARVRALPGVARAEGSIFDSSGVILGRDGKPISSGGAPNFIASASSVRRFESFDYAQGQPPRTPGEVALDQATADKEGLRLGSPLALQGAEAKKTYRIVGLTRIAGVSSFGGAAVALLTLPEAQRVTGKVGQFDQISLATKPGTSADRLRAEVRAAVGRHVDVRTGRQETRTQQQDNRRQLSFLTTALLAFAGISLFVGAFIVFNTFSITVAQRAREFALLRTLGASRAQVLRSVLTEGLVLGVLGSVVGLALGVAVAAGLKALFGAIGFDVPASGTVLLARTAIVSLVVGIVVTLVASLAPALRATRVPPVAALREGVPLPQTRSSRLAFPLAMLLTALGLGLMAVGLFASLSSDAALSLLGGGAAATFLGVALLSPRLVGPLASLVGRPLQAAFGLTGRLARENTVRQPGRTAVTAAALMIGVALVTFASIFAAGARATINDAIDAGLRGQAVLQNQNGFGPFTPAAVRAVAAQPGVSEVSAVRFVQGRVQGQRSNAQVTGIDPRTFESLYNIEVASGGEGALRGLTEGDVLVGKSYAEKHDTRLGSTLAVMTPTRQVVRLRVRGVLDDKAGLTSALVVSNALVERAFGTSQVGFALVGFAPGAPLGATKARIDRVLASGFPQVRALSAAEFKTNQADQVNQLLGLIYALLALAIVVSLFGIVNTLVLSITERTRELGLLRAIGTSRRQVRRVVRYEAVITALIGGILGLVLGIVLAVLVSQPLDDFELAIPVGSLVGVLVASGIVGVLAAVLPARRAARLDVLQALAYE